MTKNALKRWYAVDVVTSPIGEEPIVSALDELGSLGSEIDSLHKGPLDPICVTGFFHERPSPDDVNSTVERSLAIHGLLPDQVISISFRTVEDTDWLAEWKKHWKPQKTGRFIIAPPWSEVADQDGIVIRIEPSMAFGTGTHETTRLCLRVISELYSPERSFLDVGTGTGILAIAAAKLGGRNIIACDVDPGSVTIARENARANDVADEVVIEQGSITPDMPLFDLVCANLTIDVILPLLPLLTAKSRKTLLLSGILAEQEYSAKQALLSAGVTGLSVSRAGEWIAITADLSRMA